MITILILAQKGKMSTEWTIVPGDLNPEQPDHRTVRTPKSPNTEQPEHRTVRITEQFETQTLSD